MDEKIRLGGMALGNGVLVHGPTSWACAVRLPDGKLKVVAEPKRFVASKVSRPLLRGPAKLAEAFALLPTVLMVLSFCGWLRRPLEGRVGKLNISLKDRP